VNIDDSVAWRRAARKAGDVVSGRRSVSISRYEKALSISYQTVCNGLGVARRAVRSSADKACWRKAWWATERAGDLMVTADCLHAHGVYAVLHMACVFICSAAGTRHTVCCGHIRWVPTLLLRAARLCTCCILPLFHLEHGVMVSRSRRAYGSATAGVPA